VILRTTSSEALEFGSGAPWPKFPCPLQVRD
jgi:hypothetical protein